MPTQRTLTGPKLDMFLQQAIMSYLLERANAYVNIDRLQYAVDDITDNKYSEILFAKYPVYLRQLHVLGYIALRKADKSICGLKPLAVRTAITVQITKKIMEDKDAEIARLKATIVDMQARLDAAGLFDSLYDNVDDTSEEDMY
jgi:hypothetical protein